MISISKHIDYPVLVKSLYNSLKIFVRKKQIERERKPLIQCASIDRGRSAYIKELFLKAHNGSIKPLLLSEIHHKAKYNNTGIVGDKNSLFDIFIENGEVIVLATDDIIFDGRKERIREMKEKTNKPLFVLDMFSHENEVNYVRSLGADGIVLLVGLVDNQKLQQIADRAHELGMYIVAEVQYESELEIVNNIPYDAIGINTRDINELSKVDFQKILNIRQKVGPEKIIIGESGIDNVYDIIRLQESNCSGFIVGSSILNSRNIPSSIEYFKNQDIKSPYIWYRWGGKLRKNDEFLIKRLEEIGFKLIHSHQISNSDETFMALKKNLYFENPDIGRIFLRAIEQSLLITLKQAKTTDSELRFLKHDDLNLSLEEQYQILNNFKYVLRKEENEIYGKLDNINIDILIHSLHVPDTSDHLRDLEILSNRRNNKETISCFLTNQQITNESNLENY